MLKQWMRHAALVLTIAGGGALGFGAAAWAEGSGNKHVKHARLIKVSARRFVFNPSTIKLKKGETVDFELRTEDVLMGFNVPDFNVRSDIPPGQVMHLTLTPDKTGTFTFLCDIFCGSGHESMNGTLVVE